jgi:hypothetical protein
MTDIATWIASQVPANTDLAPPELGRIAGALMDEEALWRQHIRYDEAERYYNQLYRDPNIDVWLICWVGTQSTGYHDHDRSAGGVVVCEGMLHEDYFGRDADGWIRERTNVHAPGGMFIFDSTYIHGVRHPGEDAPAAASLHVYSPALWRMGHYESDENGVMRRISVTYADELLGLG